MTCVSEQVKYILCTYLKYKKKYIVIELSIRNATNIHFTFEYFIIYKFWHCMIFILKIFVWL